MQSRNYAIKTKPPYIDNHGKQKLFLQIHLISLCDFCKSNLLFGPESGLSCLSAGPVQSLGVIGYDLYLTRLNSFQTRPDEDCHNLHWLALNVNGEYFQNSNYLRMFSTLSV